MLAILAFLFYHLPLSVAQPTCVEPPPQLAQIPNLHDCYELVVSIYESATQQHDAPILWSHRPPEGVRSRKLPYVYRYPHRRDNNCAFVVTWAYDDRDEDTFPTKLIAESADEVVEKCMEVGIEGVETIGAGFAGPREVIAVVLVKDPRTLGAIGGGLGLMNMTNTTLLGPGSLSGLVSSLTAEA